MLVWHVTMALAHVLPLLANDLRGTCLPDLSCKEGKTLRSYFDYLEVVYLHSNLVSHTLNQCSRRFFLEIHPHAKSLSDLNFLSLQLPTSL